MTQKVLSEIYWHETVGFFSSEIGRNCLSPPEEFAPSAPCQPVSYKVFIDIKYQLVIVTWPHLVHQDLARRPSAFE